MLNTPLERGVFCLDRNVPIPNATVLQYEGAKDNG